MEDAEISAKKSYLDYYDAFVSPVLKNIDLQFKTKGAAITRETAARLLGISTAECDRIIMSLGIKKLNQIGFFELMKHGSSELCVLFQNEICCGMPYRYSAEDVAFIYGLDIMDVAGAFNKAGVVEATSKELSEIFSYIPLRNACRLFHNI